MDENQQESPLTMDDVALMLGQRDIQIHILQKQLNAMGNVTAGEPDGTEQDNGDSVHDNQRSADDVG